jgi:nicotinamidase/pyrazinamidase
MMGASDKEGGRAVTGYDSATALIVVDVQNDFADPKGSLYVAGGEDVVARVNEEIAEAVAAGSLVVYTQDWHPPTTPHFQSQGGVWPVHCVQETWGAAFHPALEVAGEVVRKGSGTEDGYSGFTTRDATNGEQHPTELASLLRSRGVEHVVVAGLATDYCVKETAVDAARLGWDTTVVIDATAAVNLEEGDDERARAEMASAGVHVEQRAR